MSKAAIARVLGATWQRYRVHWMRNARAHASLLRIPVMVVSWAGFANRRWQRSGLASAPAFS
jgi:transposase-like protein